MTKDIVYDMVLSKKKKNKKTIVPQEKGDLLKTVCVYECVNIFLFSLSNITHLHNKLQMRQKVKG